MKQLRRGDIWVVDLGTPLQGSSRQGGIRPAILNSCDKVLNNERCTIINVIPITTRIKNQITHIPIPKQCGLKFDSMAEVEQNQKLDKVKIKKYLGRCTNKILKQIDMVSKIDTGEVEVNHIYKLANEIKDIDEVISIYNLNNIPYDNFKIKKIKIIEELKFYCDRFQKNIYRILNFDNVNSMKVKIAN